MKTTAVAGLALLMAITGMVSEIFANNRVPPVPRIEIRDYRIEATLIPDVHELEAAAAITFKSLEPIDSITFDMSDNLSVHRVLDSEGVELDFDRNSTSPGSLTVRFSRTLAGGSTATIRIQYRGGFDRDRFSRIYSRDDSSAYIGMEGIYLLYSAKWIPILRFLTDRAPTSLEVTVPLGMTVIGAGVQSPVVTKGIHEVFGWTAKTPVLPGSIVAGNYSQKRLNIEDYRIDCYSSGQKLDSMQKAAETAVRILDFYHKAYGPPAAGRSFRLVEVDDRLSKQPGMMGTIFVTRSELARPTPPVRELARRIAYQWWQETVGIRDTGDLWLVDGMAYMSAAEYMGKVEGPEAYKEEIENLAVLALKFEKKSAVRVGLDLGYLTDEYESVVAGKGAWILNMLRGLMGDAEFNTMVRQYFHSHAGKAGGSSAFQKLAESAHGKELGWFFTQWVDTVGVPELETDYVVFKTATGFRVSGTVKQDRDLFRMPVEVGVVADGKQETKTIELKGKSTSFDLNSRTMPKQVVLDPNNKILRDSKELQTSVQLSIGNDLKESGSFVEAIRAYERALDLNPHRSLVHFRLAEVFYEQFNLQSAANSFRDALNGDKDPKWVEVWCYIYLGKIYDILGQRQRAMAEYTKAVNTKDDTFGAQAEASKWLAAPFTRERTAIQD